MAGPLIHLLSPFIDLFNGLLKKNRIFEKISDSKRICPVLGAIFKNSCRDLILAFFFTNFAFAAFLLVVALCLFDYIADIAKFDNSFKGRLKTFCLTYLPPSPFCVFYSTGFMSAIESAGFFITFGSVILP